MERLKQKLYDKGYKFTPQRKAVLEIIKEAQGKHLTAEEINHMLAQRQPRMGIATVYRTLGILVEIGLITKDYLDSGAVRYECSENDGRHHHHHMVCVRCGDILEAKEDLMAALEKSIEKNYQFKVLDHNIKFLGYCKHCI